MTDSLFGGAVPGGSEFLDGSPGIMRACTVEFAVTGQITHLCFYVGAQTGGTWTTRIWEVTANDVSNGGAGTLLTSETLGSAPSPSAWVNLALSSPVNVTDTSKLYRFGVSNGQYYWADNGFFASADHVSGNITAPQSGSSPTALGQINNGTFALLSSPTGTNYPNLTGSSANYAVDLFFEPDADVPAEGAAAVGLNLAVAAAGTVQHAGAADLGASLALAAAGSARHAGVAALTLSLDITAAGARDSLGAALLGLGLAPTGVGTRSAAGSAGLGFALAVASAGSDGSAPGAPGPRLISRRGQGVILSSRQQNRIVARTQVVREGGQ
jgi:hypothetical protein